MFLRFVVDEIDADSGRRKGIYFKARHLRDSSDVSRRDRDRMTDIFEWLGAFLVEPDRLSVSRRRRAKQQAICWFKDSAVEHIAAAYDLAAIMATYGVVVDVIRTRRPGYVVYEDEFQVAAYPFGDTPT